MASGPQLVDSCVRFQVFQDSVEVGMVEFPEVRVDDGAWHHLQVELRSVREGKETTFLAQVSLDYGMFQVRRANQLLSRSPDQVCVCVCR